LPQTNESATVAKSKIFSHLNKPLSIECSKKSILSQQSYRVHRYFVHQFTTIGARRQQAIQGHATMEKRHPTIVVPNPTSSTCCSCNSIKATQNFTKALFTSTQNPKIFKILHHIESLDACM